MVKRIAHIAPDGTVRNVSLAPDDFEPDGVTAVAARPEAEPGGRFDGEAFERAPAVVVRESADVRALRALAEEIGPGAVSRVEAELGKRSDGR